MQRVWGHIIILLGQFFFLISRALIIKFKGRFGFLLHFLFADSSSLQARIGWDVTANILKTGTHLFLGYCIFNLIFDWTILSGPNTIYFSYLAHEYHLALQAATHSFLLPDLTGYSAALNFCWKQVRFHN